MWLRDHKALMHEDTEPDGLIADGEALVPRLQALSPTKASAKSATVEDTEEIDVLDGRLLEIIAGLNDAGRKAFRALGKRTRVKVYKYHHLRGKPSESATDAPPEGGEPTPPS